MEKRGLFLCSDDVTIHQNQAKSWKGGPVNGTSSPSLDRWQGVCECVFMVHPPNVFWVLGLSFAWLDPPVSLQFIHMGFHAFVF